MNDIEQKILGEYAIALAQWQIELYRGRNQRKDDAIQRYFNSTPVRNTFSRMMFVAYHDDKSLYTKSEISRQLMITRQAASQMIDDCLAEGWIECTGKGYKASQVLENKMMDYTKFHIKTLSETALHDLFSCHQCYNRAQAKKASSDFTPQRIAS